MRNTELPNQIIMRDSRQMQNKKIVISIKIRHKITSYLIRI